MYPLPMVTAVPVDLVSADSRAAFPYALALMHNTILRGLNQAHFLARYLHARDRRIAAYLDYVTGIAELAEWLLLAEDRVFGTRRASGRTPREALGPECAPDARALLGDVRRLGELALAYYERRQDYDGHQIALMMSFGGELAARMQKQVDCLKPQRLAKVFTQDEMRRAMSKHARWFMSRPDHDFLVPFLMSHHNRAETMQWPFFSRRDLHDMHRKEQTFVDTWKLAPYNVRNGEPQEVEGPEKNNNPYE
ncbi:hypothetical protein BC834DRAFT_971872 [Gloeopeniophorella convolvens]|nr:hypothetical protein BC834DRAFT_971872 [Gloeopeniophorella convolvens]